MHKTLFTLFVALLWLLTIMPQHACSQSTEVNIGLYGLHGFKGAMPFYFYANQQGQIPENTETLFFTRASATGRWSSSTNTSGLTGGFSFFHATGDIDTLRRVELFATFSNKYLVAGGGWYADSIQQDGLSVSNGNFFSGRNATPHPRIKLATNGFIPIGQGNFAMAGLWEEGTTGTMNVVKNALLHHKNLFFRWGNPEKLQYTFGIDHYAWWSGRSLRGNTYPSKPTDYLRTVFSLPGGKDAGSYDQENVAGNQQGQYYFIFRKPLTHHTLEWRIVHPFEDFSGMVFVNAIDNLYSMSVSFHESPLIDRLLVEAYYTKHQSGTDIDRKTGEFRHRNGRDNYMNHGIYRSGFTYQGYLMGTPLFGPLTFNPDGIVTYVNNNRIIGLHTGLTGRWINRQLYWKLLATWTLNSGVYRTPYNPRREHIYTMAELRYEMPRLPLWMGVNIAFDVNDYLKENQQIRTGLMLSTGLKF